MPEEKLLKIECEVPAEHTPGQKVVWVSPVGQKVALNVPDSARPGQTLEFQIPEHIVNGPSSGNAASSNRQPSPVPAPAPSPVPAPPTLSS